MIVIASSVYHVVNLLAANIKDFAMSKYIIRGFLSKPGNSGSDVIKAEVMVTNFLVQHNLPIATANHLGPLFKEIFPDSKIAAEYASGRTKTSAIVNVALGPHCHKFLVEHYNSHPFSLGIDGSNDTGLNKMNPVTNYPYIRYKSIKMVKSFL